MNIYPQNQKQIGGFRVLMFSYSSPRLFLPVYATFQPIRKRLLNSYIKKTIDLSWSGMQKKGKEI